MEKGKNLSKPIEEEKEELKESMDISQLSVLSKKNSIFKMATYSNLVPNLV